MDRLRSLAISLAAAAVLAGCGAAATSVGAGNSGVSAPKLNVPLTLARVARIPQSDPASTVMRLWFWAQWGSLPNVVASYDPHTIQIAGEPAVFQVFTIQRSTLLEFSPHVVDDGIRGTTAFVAVEGEAAGSKPFNTSFDLRRVGDAWLITHDSLLEGSLPTAVATVLYRKPVAVLPEPYMQAGNNVMNLIRSYAATFVDRQTQLPLRSIVP